MPSFSSPFRRIADELARAAKGSGLDDRQFRQAGQSIDRVFDELASGRSGFAPVGWYVGPKHTTRSTASASLDSLLLAPIVFPRRMTLDQAVGSCTSAAASNVVRVGLYAADAESRLPTGAPLLDTTLSGAATGSRTASINVIVNPTMYWLGVVHQGAFATWRSIAGTLFDVTAVTPDTQNTIIPAAFWTTGSVTGALPSDPTIDTTVAPASNLTNIVFRRANLVTPSYKTAA